jgi:hypothetical protein
MPMHVCMHVLTRLQMLQGLAYVRHREGFLSRTYTTVAESPDYIMSHGCISLRICAYESAVAC